MHHNLRDSMSTVNISVLNFRNTSVCWTHVEPWRGRGSKSPICRCRAMESSISR